MREKTVFGTPPASIGCVSCEFKTDSIAALFQHCSETGHGSLRASQSVAPPAGTERATPTEAGTNG